METSHGEFLTDHAMQEPVSQILGGEVVSMTQAEISVTNLAEDHSTMKRKGDLKGWIKPQREIPVTHHILKIPPLSHKPSEKTQHPISI